MGSFKLRKRPQVRLPCRMEGLQTEALCEFLRSSTSDVGKQPSAAARPATLNNLTIYNKSCICWKTSAPSANLSESTLQSHSRRQLLKSWVNISSYLPLHSRPFPNISYRPKKSLPHLANVPSDGAVIKYKASPLQNFTQH